MIYKDKHSKPVWDIGYWNLRFVCYLVLEYCFLHKKQRNKHEDSKLITLNKNLKIAKSPYARTPLCFDPFLPIDSPRGSLPERPC